MSPLAIHRHEAVDRPPRLRRLVAALGVATLALLGSVAAAAPASAAEPTGPNITEQTGSITVHKHKEAGVGVPGDGSELGSLPDPLDGVQFSLYRLNGIDLTEDDGWALADTISKAPPASLKTTGEPVTSVEIGGTVYPVTQIGGGVADPVTQTGSDGIVNFDGLPLGIYLVVEGQDNGDNNITAKAAPFLVTVPYATGANTWLYNVHAYPKNSVTGITKEVLSDGMFVGETVRWQVTVDIPQLAAGETFDSFVISDDFDHRLSNPSVASVQIANASAALGADYTVGGTGSTVTVTPNRALIDAAQGETVVVVFEATVDAIGAIPNTATVEIDGTEFASNSVEVYYGGVSILKYAEGDASQASLSGAEFALYVAGAEGDKIDDPIWTGTTTADGRLSIGITVGSTEYAGLQPGGYVLVETKAPHGYSINPDERERVIDVVAGETTEIEVANTQIPAWELPFTGGNGTLWFTVGGVSLLVVALGAGLLIARRNQAKA